PPPTLFPYTTLFRSRNAGLPLMPQAVRLRLGRDEIELPRWVRPEIARRYGLHERAFEMLAYAGRIGGKYHHAVVTGLAGLGKLIDRKSTRLNSSHVS